MRKKNTSAFLIIASLKSTRLKNKVILKINGKTIIEYLVNQIKATNKKYKIIICTSNTKIDDRLEKLSKKIGVGCFRGDMPDVLKRIYDCSKKFEVDKILTITADSPLIDPNYICEVERKLNHKNDLVTAFDLPHGTYIYGMKFKALEKAIKLKKKKDTEVWGRYFTDLRNFKVCRLNIPKKYRRHDIRLTIDYPSDFKALKKIINLLDSTNKNYNVSEIIKLYNKYPNLSKINEQNKKLYSKKWNDSSEIDVANVNPKIKKILIIGMGSIGRQHYKNLNNLGNFKFWHYSTNYGHYKNHKVKRIKRLKKINKNFRNFFDLIIISNPSSLHLKTMKKFLNLSKSFFIEKPLDTSEKYINFILKKINSNKIFSYVGFNLAHHPIILKIKKVLKDKDFGKPISMQLNVGHYLPYWHKYEDYKKGYVAKKELGGGIIFTLIHEIHIATILFGSIKSVFATQQTKNYLIDKLDESVSLSFVHNNDAKSNIMMDLWQKNYNRGGKVNFENGSIEYNFKDQFIKYNLNKKENIIRLKKNSYFMSFKNMYLDIFKKYSENRYRHQNDIHSSIHPLQVALACKRSIIERKEQIINEKYKKLGINSITFL